MSVAIGSKHDVSRLAPASIAVMQQHAGEMAIAAHAPKLVPIANGVLIAIEDLDRLKGKQVALLTASDEQTAVLHGLMLGWTGLLARDLEGFDLGAFVRNPNLTFDVVQKASSLKRYVEEEGAGLPYRDALLTELTARIESASGAAESAHGARVALQDKQREVRELTVSFYKGLVGLRRTVRAVLGSKHFDYQRLRIPSRSEAEPPVETEPATDPTSTEGEAAATPASDGVSRPSSTR